jgi:hypothetical protein
MGCNHGHWSSIDLRWRNAAWEVKVAPAGAAAGAGAEAEVEAAAGAEEAETAAAGAGEAACAALWGRMMNQKTQKTMPAAMMVARRTRKMQRGLLVYQRLPSLLQKPSFALASFLSIDINFIESPNLQHEYY